MSKNVLIGALRACVLVPALALFVLSGCGGGGGGNDASTTISSIEITPATASIAKGTTQAFIAIAIYGDGHKTDVTESSVWASSNIAVATISNSTGTNGVASGLTIGSSNITATFDGSTSNISTLSVTAAVITSLSVSPANPSVADGVSQQFSASAVFSDGTHQNVTAAVAWSSSNTGVATISNTSPNNGLAQTDATGSSTIGATYMGQSASSTLTVTSAVVESVVETPASASIAAGTTEQFHATAIFSDHSTKDVTAAASWSSSNTSVATISNSSGTNGLATSSKQGSTTIGVNYMGATNTAPLTVTAATITSVAVTPTNPSIANGLTQQFSATATFSDGTTQNVTTAVTWTSSNTSIATISNATGSNGLASSEAQGTTTITATDAGVSGTTTLTVTAAVLKSIQVTPSNPSIAKGYTQQFTATGTYSDQSTMDITSSVTWASSTTSVATISNATGSNGLASTLATGSSTITATDPTSGINNSTTLTVTAAVLSSIDVTPANPSLPVGTSQQFTATAVYSDSTTKDFTTTVTWASSSTTAGEISNSSGTQGLFAAEAQGSTTISATDPTSGLVGSTMATVTAASLQSIQITPSNAKLAQGFSLQYTATGIYSDNSTQNITTSVTWSSGNTSAVTISNAGGSQGLATAAAAGGGNTTTITAALGSVQSTTPLSVTTATLSSVSVSPTNPTIAKGNTEQFTATGTFSDSSTQDLTTQVSWTSGTTATATINAQGLATSVATGTSVITATLINSTNASPGKSGTSTLTVSAATLSSIAVAPVNPSAAKGTTEQFTATGTYSDSSTADITKTVTWSSGTTSVATISNTSPSQGLATAVAVGTSTITATLSGVSGNTTLTVTSATLSSIAITPATPSVAAGVSQQFKATGTYSDASTQVITTTVTWTSSDTTVATISNASGMQGLATTLKAGMVTITATDPSSGHTGTATLTVTNATLTKLTVTPNPSTVASGQSTQLTATGTYSDNSTVDLTTQSSWTSSSSDAAVGASTGLVTGLAPGTATITATFTPSGGTATTATSALTVTQAALQSISVAPAASYASPADQVPKGFQLPYIATGHYADGSMANITASATWSTLNSAVATVSNTSGTNGVVTGVTAGSTVVIAKMSGISSTNASVVVSAATLSKITVTPATATIAQNATLQYTATGTFSDSSTLNITFYGQVTWASSNTSVATISANGLATGAGLAALSNVPTTITATITGGTINGTATLN